MLSCWPAHSVRYRQVTCPEATAWSVEWGSAPPSGLGWFWSCCVYKMGIPFEGVSRVGRMTSSHVGPFFWVDRRRLGTRNHK